MRIVLLNEVTLIGTITGNIRFDILVKAEPQGKTIIIPKHAIAYAEEV